MNFFTSLFDKFVSYKLPLPQGPFPVGTTDQHWIHEAIRVDHEKISSEFFNANCEQTAAAPTTSTNQAATFAREFEDDLHPIIQVHKEKLRTHQTMGLNVKLWFPIDDATAKASTRKTAPYLKDHFIPYMKRLNMDALPESLVKYYMSVGCNAIEANAIRQGTFPVLIFCHGMYAVPEFYTAYCENIASFGFIVVAPYHTDGSSLHVRYNFSSETLHVIEFERHPLRDYSNQFLKQEEFYLRRRQLFQRVHNVQYILEFLELVRFAQLESHILAGHLHKDNPKVSICGHSFGACTAMASCLKEPTRITAGIGLDGWYFGLSNCKEQLKVPFFCINSEMWQWDSNLEIMHDILKNAANPSHTFLHTIKNSRHHDFSDIAAIMPHIGRLVKSLGPTPLKTLDDVNRMILEFIRCYSLDFTTFEKLKTYTYEKVAVPPPVPATSNNEILTTGASEPITNTTTTATAS